MQGFEQALQIYNRQLRQGFSALRFEPPLEREFKAFFAGRNAILQRGAMIVGIVLLLAVVPLDLAFIHDPAARHFYLLGRVWITVPTLLIALLLSFHQPWRRYFPLFSFIIISLIGVTNAMVTVFTQQQGFPLTYESTLVIIMVVFSLGGMPFRLALSCGILISLSYVSLSALYLPLDLADLREAFFLFGTLLVGGVSGYTMEYQMRLSFLQRGALKNLAKTDPLTGLYNRGAINQKLHHLIYYAFREQKSVTLLLADVDFFKHYNDFYGHLQGDRCLEQIASALASCCLRPLDFAGRYGGEEFVIMWFDVPPAEAEPLARRVREAVAQLQLRHDASGVNPQVTISGGMVTGIPDSQHLVDRLLHQADQCLYRAKETGRNRILIQDAGDENSIAHLVK